MSSHALGQVFVHPDRRKALCLGSLPYAAPRSMTTTDQRTATQVRFTLERITVIHASFGERVSGSRSRVAGVGTSACLPTSTDRRALYARRPTWRSAFGQIRSCTLSGQAHGPHGSFVFVQLSGTSEVVLRYACDERSHLPTDIIYPTHAHTFPIPRTNRTTNTEIVIAQNAPTQPFPCSLNAPPRATR